ncbi:S-methyl-5-thioribose-1-phosphate isomerase, partial [Patescibacteria group bacterium]|nr:S-methyl-5-thioribose-1-phosphate isomerase [Patescibacteria group bacterium]
MKVGKKHYRTIWLKNASTVQIIDQRSLPHKFVIENLKTVDDVARAIKEMHVRGAGLIGATAGYGMYLAAYTTPDKNFQKFLQKSAKKLIGTRPTATNLSWAVKRQLENMEQAEGPQEKRKIAKKTALTIADEDARFCKQIGEHGVKLIERISRKKNGKPVNILTHCNAG